MAMFAGPLASEDGIADDSDEFDAVPLEDRENVKQQRSKIDPNKLAKTPGIQRKALGLAVHKPKLTNRDILLGELAKQKVGLPLPFSFVPIEAYTLFGRRLDKATKRMMVRSETSLQAQRMEVKRPTGRPL